MGLPPLDTSAIASLSADCWPPVSSKGSDAMNDCTMPGKEGSVIPGCFSL